MSPRFAAGCAGLGALVAVLAWAGWGVVNSDASSEAPPRLAAGVPSVNVLPATAHRPPASEAHGTIEATPRAVDGRAGSSPGQGALAGPATPVLRDGMVMEHGMLTAVRSPVRADVAQPAPVNAPVTLPLGARPEDVVVSTTGIVAVMRTSGATRQASTGDAAPEAAGDAAGANPFRPATATHSP